MIHHTPTDFAKGERVNLRRYRGWLTKRDCVVVRHTRARVVIRTQSGEELYVSPRNLIRIDGGNA